MSRKIGFLLLITAVPLLILVSLFGLVQPAHAADFTVGADCPTIQACIDLAAAGDQVLVPPGAYNESLTLDKAVTISGADSATVIIQALAGQRVMTVTGAAVNGDVAIANLTLTGGDVSGGNICYAGDFANCGGGMVITNTARPRLLNLIFQNNRAYQGGGLYVFAGSPLTQVQNVTFTNNASVLSGGGAYFGDETAIQDSLFRQNASEQNVGGALSTGAPANAPFTLTISNTVFSDNRTCTLGGSICHGGALRAFDMNVVIQNSRFENNACLQDDCDGGAINVGAAFNGADVYLENTNFVSNTATRNGGGLYAGSSFTWVTVEDGRFERNTAATGNGGGLIAAALTLTGTQFFTNSAGASNGAFSYGGGGAYTALTTTLSEATFAGNVSDEFGGGLYVNFTSSPVQIEATTFFSNVAALTGGGATINAINPTRISDSRFSYNRTLTPVDGIGFEEGNGAGLWINGELHLANSEFLSNTAVTAGGGLWSENGAVFIQGGLFQNNRGEDASAFTVGGGGVCVGGGDLVFTDTQFIANTAVADVAGGAYVAGLVTGTNGLFQDNQSGSSGGGLYVNTGLTLNGTQFSGNTAVNSGGGVFANRFGAAEATVSLSNTRFTENEATSFSGGGLYSDGPTAIYNGQFLSNTAGSGGGVAAFSVLTVTGGLFRSNQAGSSGGGLSSSFDGAYINATQFVRNTAVSQGGGVSASGALTLLDATFRGNHSDGQGGGVGTSGQVIAADATFISNTAGTNGGGVYANSGIDFENGRFQGNEAGGHGGGYYGPLGNLRAAGTTFTANQAGGNGGGAYAFNGTAVGDVLFSGNSSQAAGGGLFLHRFVHVTRTTFLNNSAALGGGLAVSRTQSGSSVQFVHNALFSGNSATGAGAGFYYNQPRPLNLIHTTFTNAAPGPGQAVYVVTGTVNLTNTIVASFTTGIENGGGLVNASHTLFFGNGNNLVGGVGADNSLVADPDFVDAAAGDFRLVDGSPAVDSGIDAGLAADIIGVARPRDAGFDRGAYEGRHTPTAVSLAGFAAQGGGSVRGVVVGLVMMLLGTAVALITKR